MTLKLVQFLMFGCFANIQVATEAWASDTWGNGWHQRCNIYLTFSISHVVAPSSSVCIICACSFYPVCYHKLGTGVLNVQSAAQHEISVPSVQSDFYRVSSGMLWYTECISTCAVLRSCRIDLTTFLAGWHKRHLNDKSVFSIIRFSLMCVGRF